MLIPNTLPPFQTGTGNRHRYHRRELAESIGKSALDTELVYTESVFEADAKNYHAWAHRQYLLRLFLSEDDYRWNSELSFCDSMIDEDVRNNSAWNHRYFTIRRGGKVCMVLDNL